jgi:hypothetical protein
MRFPSTRPLGKLAASMALAGTIGLSGGAALAQDATPATPIGPAACTAPAGGMAATPVDAAAMASPVAEGEAPTGTVVEDDAVIAEATAAIENLYACFNEGNGEAFVALYTEQGRLSALGNADPAQLAAEITAKSGMVQASGITVNEVLATADGALIVDYQATVGQQVLHFADVLVQQGDAWLVDGRAVETPETDLDSTTASIKTSVADGGLLIEASPSPLSNQEAVKFQVTNGTESAQNVVLLQGGDAASITSLDFTALPEGVTFVGEVHVAPGAIIDTLFEGLAEGNYVIVVEGEDGTFGTLDLTIDPPFDPNA